VQKFQGKIMKTRMLFFAVAASAGIVFTPPTAVAQQVLHGHVLEAMVRFHLQPISCLSAANYL
jgi:hypothetical protein